MPEFEMPDPIVDTSEVTKLARDLVVIPNHGVQLVSNIGVIGDTDVVLVIDTGMGPGNAATALKSAVDYAHGRELDLEALKLPAIGAPRPRNICR